MSDYEDYLKQQQAERGRVYNDMTLDERLAEFIEYCQQKTERYLVIDAHMEIFNLRDENTRLDSALLATSNELTDATNQINELNEENNLLHDALTKLQARYDETEASSFQHLRENEQMRVALECTYNWAMTDETEPNGGFDIFAEEIIPMIGKVLGRE